MSPAGLLALALIGTAASGARWHVDARAAASGADGSEARPFRSISQAVARAGGGDTIAIAPGLYVERLVLDRPVQLRGSDGTVLRPPEPAGDVVRIEAEATLERLRIEGGEVGVRVQAPAELRALTLEEPLQAAIHVERGRTRLTSSRIHAIDESRASVVPSRRFGVRVDAGAQLVASEVALEGPFRFAVRLHGAADLDRLSVSGAIGGVACLEGCNATVAHSSLARGGEIGLLAGAGGRLTARDCLVTRYETGIGANPGSTLRLEETMTAFCLNAGVAAVQAEVVAVGHVHLGPARMAGIQLLGSNTQLFGGAVLDPGPTGVAMRLGTLVARGLSVRGARLDAESDLGDGLFAQQPEKLLLFAARLEQNAGAGLSVLGGRARVDGLEVSRNGIAGVLAQHEAEVWLAAARIRENGGPGVVAIEGSRVVVVASRLEANSEGPTHAHCASRSQILLAADSPQRAYQAACAGP